MESLNNNDEWTTLRVIIVSPFITWSRILSSNNSKKNCGNLFNAESLRFTKGNIISIVVDYHTFFGSIFSNKRLTYIINVDDVCFRYP